jgi:hypothetical protein
VVRECGAFAEMHNTTSGIFGGRDFGLAEFRPQRTAAEAVAG